ncbi:phospholipase D-like domain-containing protein [Methylobacterium radiodurans]|uniref:Phospholipase D n=1 Tax=Methylobacterium radiodurans TaxID=2202828 RepID=A0A2U8VSM1_9HYPH|nr:phospholipase D-like domain-containing protein [Methylobacterium radiodurans]AWN36744.1 phospholipase [Methylobacterium radiodurans]
MTVAVKPSDLPVPHPAPSGALRTGETCWRQVRAPRAALLHDGAAYFAAARQALVAARHSILLIGWSFDPRTCLRPESADPSADEALGDLLRRLKLQRPELAIRLLIWDMPWPISANSDMKPPAIRERLGPGIDYRIDPTLPFGACQHQKILVVDDRIAFCGGSDFEANRWDTPAHRDRDARRRLPSGEAYPPRHDVMMAVDGDAARALAALARERWHAATSAWLPPEPAAAGPVADSSEDPWPETLAPDFADVPLAIARTVPARGPAPAIRENEALFLRAIAGARRSIYLENQYFTAPLVAEALGRRLEEPDGPEIVVVVAERSPNGFDRLTMDSARRGLIARLKARDRFGRFRILAPHTVAGQPILVHSKVSVFDDTLLRVGSTNLNNRSFGYDTECDLAISAGDGTEDAELRATIARTRDRMLAHHAGCDARAFAARVAERGSLRAALDDVVLVSPRRLCPLVASHRGLLARFIEAWHIGDPDGPDDAWRPWRRPGLLRAAVRAKLGD